ncbi:MAG: UDPGP type 1 family protein, partial [Kiritimatiellaeota bacterium]|nr:UDPGP type 1 family protein [Kiritimatiellota bacterium]
MTLDDAKKLLEQHKQAHLLKFWGALGGPQRAGLLAQIATLDFKAIARMQKLLAAKPAAKPAPMAPASVLEFSPAQRKKAVAAGEAALAKGEVGVILVAGGQGSRLGISIPKGAMEIGPVSEVSLFWYHARRVLAMSRRCGKPVPFYIMTSETNDADTRAFFERHNFFGLPAKDVFFFKQGMWPALTPEGKIILKAPAQIFMSPDGHGGTLSALKASGALDDMRKRGLSTLFYFQVDNPLVEVADPAFIGAHLLAGADYSLKLCAKRDADEGLGVVVKRAGKHEMVEYTELTDAQKNQRTPKGGLYFKYGSVAIHVFSLAFLRKQARTPMPLHLAHKKITCVDAKGVSQEPGKPNGYKFEKFIFDLLPHAKKVVNLAFDRRDEFSPVKNAAG